MSEPVTQKTNCERPENPEAKEAVELMPAEKKLIGWSLGLGFALLVVLIITSRAF